MGKKFKLEKGDVFAIPLTNEEYGFGQVISSYDNRSGGFMVAIFDYKNIGLQSISIDKICSKEVLFLGFTFDAKLYHKHWVLVGRYDLNIKNIQMPYFRLGTPPNDIYIVNFKGERLYEINEDVFCQLSYKSEIAPVRYENALKAYYGLQEWKENEYGNILYKYTLQSNVIYENLMGKP